MVSRVLILLIVALIGSALRISVGQSVGDVRLVGGPENYPNVGRLDIFWKGRWGTFCELSKEGGDAACRQLGYDSDEVVYCSTASVGIPKAGNDMPIALGSSSCESQGTSCSEVCLLSGYCSLLSRERYCLEM